MSNKNTKETATKKMLFLGYVFALLGGALGIIMGMNYIFAKKIDLSGKRVKKYDKKTRTHGIIMTIIGVFGFVIGKSAVS